MSNGCLVDSNIWIALYKRDDSTHQRAKKQLATLESQGVKLFVTNFIIQETWTVLRYFTDHQRAMRFYLDTQEAEHIQQLDFDSQWMEELFGFIEEYKLHQKMSLVDYSNMYFALVFGLELISFDKQMTNLYNRIQKRLQ